MKSLMPLRVLALAGACVLEAAARADPPVFPAGTDLYFGIVPQAASPTSGTSGTLLSPVQMNVITIKGRAANLVGLADSAASGRVGQKDIAERPLLRPGEVLEAVPGLLVTQHSGDGKANQYFTRGFNLDHGTDFSFNMDGIPINQPTNAHGEGYSDLNFVIPELIRSVSYTKGPFDVEYGDFATAGSANFTYEDVLPRYIAELTMGSFGYQRALAAYPMALWGGDEVYALEVASYDGPWRVHEDYKKYNGYVSYSRGPADDHLSVCFSAYQASWNATNQTPQDAVAQGALNEYGSLSPSDGGDRVRDFLWGNWTGRTAHGETDVLAYLGYSHLDLWNDFTFYLPYQSSGTQLAEGLAQDQFANPGATGGNQFQQTDDRIRAGTTLKRKFHAALGRIPTENEVGLDLHGEDILVGLYNTQDRLVYETDSLNRVLDLDAAPYLYNRTDWTPWLRTVLGFREDSLVTRVANQTPAVQDGVNLTTATGPAGPNAELAPLSAFVEGAGVGTTSTYAATLPEPKAALILRPDGWPAEFYLNFGQGFHTNDARELRPGVQPMVQADSEEAGARYADGDAYETTFAAWRMDMASEMTFDGDTAQSTPNGPSVRQGLEWSNTMRIQPFYLDLDGAVSQARFLGLDTVDDPLHPGYWVPEAVGQVGTMTLGMDEVDGWSVDTRVRYFGSRALTPDDAVRSPPSVLVSLQVIRHLWAGQSITLALFNLLNENVPDISYYYAYAQPGVDNGLAHEAVMAHPTEPLSLRVTWTDSL